MTPDQLCELADALEPMAAAPVFERLDIPGAVAFLRQCAEQRPDAWMYEHDGCVDTPIITASRWAKCEEPWTETALYLHPVPAVPTIEERGPWSAGQDKQQAWEQRVWIESDDFAYDVRLYVNGNFESHDQRFAYAQEIARRLNAAPTRAAGRAEARAVER